MTIHRMYNINLQKMQTSALRLSTGLRINSAKDDPAGLVISERMRAQIRGLHMAARNAQDGVSLIQTAEGAMAEVHGILQRMKELAVQSANGTNLTLDRNALAAEFNHLREELNDISRSSNYNDMNLFDGSQMGKTGGQAVDLVQGGGGGLASAVITNGDRFTVAQTGKYYFEVDDKGIHAMKNGVELDMIKAEDINWVNGEILDFTLNANGSKITLTLSGSNVAQMKADIEATSFKVENTASGKYKDVGLVLQTGAREGHTLAISIDRFHSYDLKLDGLDISTQAGAGEAITAVDKAINRVSDQRAYLGAIHNRLERAIDNLINQAMNLSEAESRIRDADMAKEMMEYIRASILMQVGIAMMAQTNSMSEIVLKLLMP